MYEGMALFYGLLTSFVLTSASRSRQFGRPLNQKIVLLGWALASTSITLAVSAGAIPPPAVHRLRPTAVLPNGDVLTARGGGPMPYSWPENELPIKRPRRARRPIVLAIVACLIIAAGFYTFH
jgi:hypothetical protein